MKIDKDNPKHWYYLIRSALNVFLSMPFRLFKSKNESVVVFYYQMHGNSKAISDYIGSHNKQIKQYFLAFPEYQSIYKGRHNLETLSPLRFRDMIKVAKSDVIITNYGAQTLIYLAKLTSIKFVDVWHGLPMLKMQTPKIINFLNSYTQVWVASEKMKEFYKNHFLIKSNLKITGYARVDGLIKKSYKDVKSKYRIPDKKVILVAPTWKQNDSNRSILPFGLNQEEFINKLDSLAKKTDSHIIFRAHMLSGSGLTIKNKITRISSMPVNKYPDTEELLSIADMVITDWSSLVFDFLATNNPVIFIDVKAPFKDEEIGVRANPKNRFGPLVKNYSDFENTVIKYLGKPQKYQKDYSSELKRVTEIAHGDTLDGNSAKRGYTELLKLLSH